MWWTICHVDDYFQVQFSEKLIEPGYDNAIAYRQFQSNNMKNA